MINMLICLFVLIFIYKSFYVFVYLFNYALIAGTCLTFLLSLSVFELYKIELIAVKKDPIPKILGEGNC